ncbi:hypothetical protein G7Y89_g10580 [Cudoniella acicularis]|uniref:Glycosyl hydrolase family 13 catalytic domain-containing protein n=1 Tax=Cudoniella acicularis TaxID=354080 RepID=A0A8H4RCH5_9HELO|nr:hypothetical protein G7Y89_g10580 [Cudoniella acicularis]
MDVINFISKVPGLPDAAITRKDQAYQWGSKYFACGPRLHEHLLAMGKILKEYNAFSVGEMPCVQDPKEILNAVAFDRGELNMIFHFEIVELDIGDRGKFSPRQWQMSRLKEVINNWQTFMINNDGWNALYLENHDQSRSVSRWGSDAPEFRVICAKMFATFLTLQSGTLFVYQGQELGMVNIPKTRPVSEYKDLETLNAWNETLEKYPDDKEWQRITNEEIWRKSRDNARTPMQWDTTPHAGFSTTTPWQKENESYTTINASSQVNAKDSVFSYWASILRLRKSHEIFIYGDFELVDAEHEDVFAYKRSFEGKGVLIVANFRKEVVKWIVPKGVLLVKEKVLTKNYENGAESPKYQATRSSVREDAHQKLHPTANVNDCWAAKPLKYNVSDLDVARVAPNADGPAEEPLESSDEEDDDEESASGEVGGDDEGSMYVDEEGAASDVSKVTEAF